MNNFEEFGGEYWGWDGQQQEQEMGSLEVGFTAAAETVEAETEETREEEHEAAQTAFDCPVSTQRRRSFGLRSSRGCGCGCAGKKIDLATLEIESDWTRDAEVGAVTYGHWEAIPRGITIDSGAADSVIPPNWLPQFPKVKGVAATEGIGYIAANGERIPNEGEQRVSFVTREGQKKGIVFQVAPVNKPLGSVSKIVHKGHRVVFDDGPGASYILNKQTGQKTELTERNGVYVLDAWTPAFGRPGRQ